MPPTCQKHDEMQVAINSRKVRRRQHNSAHNMPHIKPKEDVGKGVLETNHAAAFEQVQQALAQTLKQGKQVGSILPPYNSLLTSR